MGAERVILLTFDHEEFDMPLEYNSMLPFNEQIEVSRQGFKNLKQVLALHNITTTFFTTATYALENKDEIKDLSAGHEIASHAYYHSAFKEADLLSSKLALEEIIEKPVYGFRMPRMKQTSLTAIKDAGYLYDSSVNPTWIPGRYNFLRKPRTLYTENNLFRLPASVTPGLRVPLFWLMFKNIPQAFYNAMALYTLRSDNVLSLYFHPWEFADLAPYKIPGYTKKVDGVNLIERLDKLIKVLKTEATFTTIKDYISEQKTL